MFFSQSSIAFETLSIAVSSPARLFRERSWSFVSSARSAAEEVILYADTGRTWPSWSRNLAFALKLSGLPLSSVLSIEVEIRPHDPIGSGGLGM
ncbi:hypothetical protein [Kribbella sp. ALI-6-A]|uniref:hypothetical protein n=1 Tax=Kribbella sp. ALI-6-A TaxID=1933817 RepID=UPI00117A8E3E|nr:hypothetical protein [Kribbella sp. ALI-6-A]